MELEQYTHKYTINYQPVTSFILPRRPRTSRISAPNQPFLYSHTPVVSSHSLIIHYLFRPGNENRRWIRVMSETMRWMWWELIFNKAGVVRSNQGIVCTCGDNYPIDHHFYWISQRPAATQSRSSFKGKICSSQLYNGNWSPVKLCFVYWRVTNTDRISFLSSRTAN